jgi:hypothetical protein
MPVWGIVIVLLFALPLIPGLEFLATVLVMVTVPLLLPFGEMAKGPAAALGVSHLAHWIMFGLVAVIVLALAAPFALRVFRAGRSGQQRARNLNALIVILGVPAMIALVWVRLAHVWVP